MTTTRPTRLRSALSIAAACALGAALWLTAGRVAHAQDAVTARAQVEPGPELAVGEAAQLLITVDASDATPPDVRADGIDLNYAGQSVRTSILNGQVSTETVFTYDLVARQAGRHQIPAVTVETAEGTATTQPLALRVSNAASGGARASAAPAPGQPPAEPGEPADPSRAFVRLALTERPAFVGQAVPVTIHAYFQAGTGVTLNGLPRLTADDATLSRLSEKPRQSETQIRGVPYTELTWSAVLTAVKAGPANLAVELPAQLTYRARVAPTPQRARAPSPMAQMLAQSPFANDPFFARMFKNGDPFDGAFDGFDGLEGRLQQRDVTLRDPGHRLAIAELPTANRPAGFSGAVGAFEASASVDARSVRAGEPTTLTVTVTGRGSFDRLASAGVPASDRLKTYAVTEHFTPRTDPIGGEKTFTQTVVPTHAGTVTVPAVAVSYFDPKARRYVTRETAPVRLSVGESEADATTNVAASDAPAEATVPASPTLAAPASADRARRSLVPIYRTPRFWGLTAALVLLTLALAGTGWARRSDALARWRNGRRGDHRVLAQRRVMERAARAGDAGALLAAGRAALQSRLGALWGLPAEAISAADVEARLGPRGTEIKALFERADQASYAGTTLRTGENLEHWRGLVTSELRKLEAQT